MKCFTIGWAASIESLMDETESIVSDPCNSYSQWEELFYSNLENWTPLLNKYLITDVKSELTKAKIPSNLLDEVDISCSFFEQVDYAFHFTIKFEGPDNILNKIIETIIHPYFKGAVIQKTDVYFNPSYGEECSPRWDAYNHNRPTWPPNQLLMKHNYFSLN